MASGYAATPKKGRSCLRRRVRPKFFSNWRRLALPRLPYLFTLKTKGRGGDHRHRGCASDLARLETMPDVENCPWIAITHVLAVYYGLWL
jgi:hypothetical protein